MHWRWMAGLWSQQCCDDILWNFPFLHCVVFSFLLVLILYCKIVTIKLEIHFLPHFYPIWFTNKIYNLDNHTMYKLFANKIHEISERNVIIFWLNFDCMFLTVNFGKVCKNRFFSSFLVKTRLQREKFVFVASKNNYVLA